MAFTAKRYWDSKKRNSFRKKEISVKFALSQINNETKPFDLRQDLKNKFSKSFKKNSSLCRIKNRCLMTNRAYSVNRFFRVSRLAFRELARNGALLGVKRSSW
jgi:ribosomal protein S14